MKNLVLLGGLLLSLCLAGCGDVSNATSSGETPPLSTVDQETLPETKHLPEELSEEPQFTSPTPGVDIDLTQMGASMVYSMVFQMVMQPETYVGQVLRMEGSFFHYQNPETGKDYFSAIVADATECCTEGLEFLLVGAQGLQDYPTVGENVTVTGTLEAYEENGYTNIRLVDAELLE